MSFRSIRPEQTDEVLDIATAARIADRSESWVRVHRRFGPLIAAEICGRQAVTAESLLAMLRQRKPSAPQLRLIVDNTKK